VDFILFKLKLAGLFISLRLQITWSINFPPKLRRLEKLHSLGLQTTSRARPSKTRKPVAEVSRVFWPAPQGTYSDLNFRDKPGNVYKDVLSEFALNNKQINKVFVKKEQRM